MRRRRGVSPGAEGEYGRRGRKGAAVRWGEECAEGGSVTKRRTSAVVREWEARTSSSDLASITASQGYGFVADPPRPPGYHAGPSRRWTANAEGGGLTAV
ncbi:hypothetical protein OF83DRAFT_338256 [Amylostereum chailletii]|nr:hypothetical protein OF83DRAFT_338256 [Amylostereum chailletii]